MLVMGYMANQGFYLYRNGRLISKPTWFGLEKNPKKENYAELGLISIIKGFLWQLDVKKLCGASSNCKRRLKKILKL
ncbi:MAG: hypothetical protein CM15mP30_4940 [Pelagibacteraceae bacterium]|nr:MAG: hypothetical protein CM15mP30_4940 [Pelagibacteraceae bacterium]